MIHPYKKNRHERQQTGITARQQRQRRYTKKFGTRAERKAQKSQK